MRKTAAHGFLEENRDAENRSAELRTLGEFSRVVEAFVNFCKKAPESLLLSNCYRVERYFCGPGVEGKRELSRSVFR